MGRGPVLRRLIQGLTAIICLPLIYAGAATVGALLSGASAALPSGSENLIGLVRGPIHYDFLLPLSADLRARYGFAEAAGVPVRNPQAEWLLVGWGAAGFYTTARSYADISVAAVARAVTGDAAVLHLDVAGDVSHVDGIAYLTLSDGQFAALLTAIDASFQHDQTGAALALPQHFGPHDAFFAAKGRFHLFHTCNDWLGETLRAAGVPFGAWTPTPQAVALAVNWHLT